ncbi:hypothetical protein AVEN_234403-1 [Araneus ventricosus]|uniref:Uncharacterized protein n=1 Tax=Araneus ventricosus TaxID=182803 RepID=A0A4Y2A9V4_ARAVE|nr:hypothetical protein AVEN_234403-1 [Araneus ventricosus]
MAQVLLLVTSECYRRIWDISNCYELRVYGENSPTNRIMENDALFTNIQERRNTGNRINTALAQFSNTNKQQITNNNSNSDQRLADQLANSQCEQDPKEILRAPNTFPVESKCRVFIVFLTGSDDTWKSLEKSGSRFLKRYRENSSIFEFLRFVVKFAKVGGLGPAAGGISYTLSIVTLFSIVRLTRRESDITFL